MRPIRMRIKKPPLRIIALALIALSLLAALIVFADERPVARESKVHVQFFSRPDNSDVYIDGKFVGSSDVGLRLSPGVHSIEIKHEDYESWTRELTVTAENPTRVAAMLKRLK